MTLDKQFPVEQFEAGRAIRADGTSVSSTLPPLKNGRIRAPRYLEVQTDEDKTAIVQDDDVMRDKAGRLNT